MKRAGEIGKESGMNHRERIMAVFRGETAECTCPDITEEHVLKCLHVGHAGN